MLGVVVLAIALVALQNPSNDNKTAGAPKTTPHLPVLTTPHASVQTTTQPTITPTITPTVTPTITPTTSASSSGSVGKLPLVVLNNTKVSGLANQAKVRFESGGWTVISTGNIVNDIISTCAYYDPSVPGAQAAAELLRQQFPAIKRTAPKFAELPAGPIIVVLTTDYASS